MSAVSETLSHRSSKALPTILLAGLIAGTLDMTGACVVAYLRAGVTPARVMRFIASGLLGAQALTGGVSMAALGTLLHYVIATTWAATFYLASRRLKFMTDYPIPVGVLYAVVVYLIMNFVVLPLSQVSRRPVPLSSHIIGCTILIFCIGLPIALIVRRETR